jgi:hypothetical protein
MIIGGDPENVLHRKFCCSGPDILPHRGSACCAQRYSAFASARGNASASGPAVPLYARTGMCSLNYVLKVLRSRSDGISDDIHPFNQKLREWEDYYKCAS